MSDCKGLFGKLFGHDYKVFKKSHVSDVNININIPISPESIEKLMEGINSRFEICCKRCGGTPNEHKK